MTEIKKMKFEIRKPGEFGVLTFEGDLTIAHAGEIRNALLDALRSVKRLEYVVKNATSVDLSFLQLLCSARRTAVHMGKDLVQGADPGSKVFSDAMRSAGYVRHMGYDGESLNTCFWRVEKDNQ